MPARPFVSPQLPVEGVPGRAVNMDLKLISSLPQSSPILDEERIKSSTFNIPTDGHNHQVDYLSPLSPIWSVDKRGWAFYPENRIVDVHDDDFPTTYLSDPESMCQTMSPLFTTVCELTIYPSPLI